MATKHRISSKTKICLLGASFDTGNLGVSALTESAIKVILNRWPDAEVTLAGLERTDGEYHLKLWGREVRIKKMPIRFCKNIFLPNHFCVLFFYGFLSNTFQWQWLSKTLADRNPYFKALSEAAIVADITGGDSFSDIYGMRRFIIGFLRKWLVLMFNKDLIMLPQTYGPFKRRTARAMAKYILNRVSLVYSRDRASMEYVNVLLNNRRNGKVRFAPDVAFVLDHRRPDNQDIDSLERIKTSNRILVGLNVSGLLSFCGDASNNVFNLKVDYYALVNSIVESLMKHNDTAILLVPHVVALHEPDALSSKSIPNKKGYREQSDAVPCGKIYEWFCAKYGGRIFLVRGHYDHNETKYIIGLCDFFIGSRMHACIAALSQCIPAVGLAYSKKFSGVFESVGAEELVVDMRRHTQDEILAVINNAFEKRAAIAECLHRIVPDVQAKILSIFKDFQ